MDTARRLNVNDSRSKSSPSVQSAPRHHWQIYKCRSQTAASFPSCSSSASLQKNADFFGRRSVFESKEEPFKDKLSTLKVLYRWGRNSLRAINPEVIRFPSCAQLAQTCHRDRPFIFPYGQQLSLPSLLSSSDLRPQSYSASGSYPEQTPTCDRALDK